MNAPVDAHRTANHPTAPPPQPLSNTQVAAALRDLGQLMLAHGLPAPIAIDWYYRDHIGVQVREADSAAWARHLPTVARIEDDRWVLDAELACGVGLRVVAHVRRSS